MSNAAIRCVLAGVALLFAAPAALLAQQATGTRSHAVAVVPPPVERAPFESPPAAREFRDGEGGRGATVRIGADRLIGAAVGFVVGAAGAYAIVHSGGSTSLCDRSSNQDAWSSGECAAVVVAGGVVGAGVGLILARALGSSERRLVPAARFGVGPATGGGVRAFVHITRAARPYGTRR